MTEEKALEVLKEIQYSSIPADWVDALRTAIEALTPTEEKTPADIMEACQQVSGVPLDYFLAGMHYAKTHLWHDNTEHPETPKTGEADIPIVYIQDGTLQRGRLVFGAKIWSVVNGNVKMPISKVEKWCYADDINLE